MFGFYIKVAKDLVNENKMNFECYNDDISFPLCLIAKEVDIGNLESGTKLTFDSRKQVNYANYHPGSVMRLVPMCTTITLRNSLILRYKTGTEEEDEEEQFCRWLKRPDWGVSGILRRQS